MLLRARTQRHAEGGKASESCGHEQFGDWNRTGRLDAGTDKHTELEGPLVCEEAVLGLDVAVRKPQGVHVREGRGDLQGEVEELGGGEPAVACPVVLEQVAVGAVLQHGGVGGQRVLAQCL